MAFSSQSEQGEKDIDLYKMSSYTQGKCLYQSLNICSMSRLSWIVEMLLKVLLGERKSEFPLQQIKDQEIY